MKKLIIATVLIIVLIGNSGQTFAFSSGVIEEERKIEISTPDLMLISSINPSLRVSGTTATYALTVVCATTVNSTKAVLQIQQLSNGVWSDYGRSWDASSSSSYLHTSGTVSVASGFSYRLKVTITASTGSSSGSATAYS